jgi:hypothetical protein
LTFFCMFSSTVHDCNPYAGTTTLASAAAPAATTAAAAVVQAAVQQRGLADLLVIDPPWENASARRSGRYATLTPNHLLHMPIKQLLKQVRPSPAVALQ